MKDYSNYVCLVTGATRGIGKGIALGLANLGATIYITGRTLKSTGNGVWGSLEETVAEITARGGKPIPVQVDHSDDQQVQQLFDQIRREQRGRLDVLVNNVYAGVNFLIKHQGQPFYEITDSSPGTVWDTINNVGLRNHYVCATLATRMMAECRRASDGPKNPGLIVNVSSIGGKRYLFNAAYGIGKAACDRMASDMAVEIRKGKLNICIVSLWPGLVRTEEMLNAAQSISDTKPLFDPNDPELTESPEFVGQAVAALATEPADKLLGRSGNVVLVCDIGREYGLRDHDGYVPPDLRAFRTMLLLAGFKTLHRFVPSFVRLPQSLYMQLVNCYSEK